MFMRLTVAPLSHRHWLLTGGRSTVSINFGVPRAGQDTKEKRWSALR